MDSGFDVIPSFPDEFFDRKQFGWFGDVVLPHSYRVQLVQSVQSRPHPAVQPKV